MGCPIRKSLDQRLFAPTQGLSQLITSFIASVSQGIRHAPFLTFFAFFVITYKECSSYFQLLCDSKEFEVVSSIIRMLILPIIERIVLHYSLACVNMSKILCCYLSVLRRCLRNVDSMVENNGFEPLTPCVQSRCSSQLS